MVGGELVQYRGEWIVARHGQFHRKLPEVRPPGTCRGMTGSDHAAAGVYGRAAVSASAVRYIF